MALSDLTLVMMTGNRPKMFEIMLGRYAETLPGIKLLVGDFGRPEMQPLNAEIASRYDYVSYFPFEPTTPYQVRLGFLMARCDTLLAVPAADDDLLVPAGVTECVQYLLDHPDYSAAHGIYYDLTPSPETNKISLRIIYAGRSYDSPDPYGRLLTMMQWYLPLFYAIQRTDDLRAMKLPDEIYSATATEMFLACSMVVNGKTKRLDVPYYLRNNEPTEPQAPLVHFSDFLMQGAEGMKREYLPFRAAIAEQLRKKTGQERDWNRLIDCGFLMWIKVGMHPERMREAFVKEGILSGEDDFAIGRPGFESLPRAVPMEQILEQLNPLIAAGWPQY